jgi:NADPH:quinone reductase-like Zn-dependent oxidoreductase
MNDNSTTKTNKAVIYDKPGSISTKVVELDIPEPGYGEVLLRLLVKALPIKKP